jgi:hypothetical protein
MDSKMKFRYTGFLFLVTFFFSGISWATPPQLGQWNLLFSNDDGRAVALDVYRETPVILDEKGHIFFLNKEIGKESTGDWFGEVYESWQKVSGGGEAMDISIDGDGVPWVVGLKSNKIYHLDGNFASPNSSWLEYPGNGKARRISVSKANGSPYMIGARSGHIYGGDGKAWKMLPVKLLDSSGQEISDTFNALDLFAESYNAGSSDKPDWYDLVFIINHDKKIFIYLPEKKGWQELPGNARASALVSSGKLVYIIAEDGKFYGLDLSKDKEWTPAGPGSGKDLAFSQVDTFQPFLTQGGKKVPSSSHRHVWTISKKGQVLRAFVAY